MSRPRTRPTIVFAVTVDQSLKLLHGHPEFVAGRGWDVHVVSAGDSGRDVQYYLGESPSVTFHRVPMVRDPSRRDLCSLVAWVRLLRRLRPDVVCLGTPKASLLGLAAARLLFVPVRVYLIRGFRFEAETGRRRRLLVVLERVTTRLATHVLAVSHSLRQVAIDEGVTKAGDVAVLGRGSSNGVRLPEPQSRQAWLAARETRGAHLGLVPGVPVVGFVGRLTPDKGLTSLVAATTFLHESGVPVQLLLVGAEDRDGYVAGLTRDLRDCGVGHALTGYVERPVELMALMDVFCLPSVREGMPNVSLEAAAMELPVVTTSATGCRDSVVPGLTGLVCPVDDPVALAIALRELLNDPARRRGMGAAGATWVAAQFERSVVWDRHERYYRSLLP